MTLQFLGHAGFLVHAGNDLILCDPWFSPYGAYAASWFPFPANDMLDLTALERATHLYVSHWHEDHLDEWFLRTRSEQFKREVSVVIPKFEYPLLRDTFLRCGYANILEIEEEYRTENGTRIYIQRDENPLYSDSSITIGSNNFVFVNSNDCKLTIGQEEEILRRFGAVTAYAAQFSGATFHPTCYDYDSQKKKAISRIRREAKYQRIVSSMDRLGALRYIPSAGPACFLDPSLYHLNLSSETVFSTASNFFEWLGSRLRNWQFYEMLPGEKLELADISTEDRLCSEHYESESYLREYADRKAQNISERRSEFSADVSDVLSEAKIHFQSKLTNVPALATGAKIILRVQIGDNSFFVDTVDGNISDIPLRVQKRQQYRLEIPEFWMKAILRNKIRWEDFILSFRFSISRKPDTYNEAFVAFLQLDTKEEREDYVRHLELLDRRTRERIQRANEGSLIEYDRYCPHNCEDLSNAMIENGVITCPRHFWRFSLEDGRGLNNPGSIHLKHL